ncbi:hypothetical protein DL765_009484 [Monosporascus sp. GIB2]|nr:hypothetical protein DL765_009484 [Monosporascus sp. GIB2]
MKVLVDSKWLRIDEEEWQSWPSSCNEMFPIRTNVTTNGVAMSNQNGSQYAVNVWSRIMRKSRAEPNKVPLAPFFSSLIKWENSNLAASALGGVVIHLKKMQRVF